MIRRLATIVAVCLLSGCDAPTPQPDGGPRASVRLWNEHHDGHVYVLRGTGHFIHSPACPCQTRRRLAEDADQ